MAGLRSAQGPGMILKNMLMIAMLIKYLSPVNRLPAAKARPESESTST
jgi:hypothetical protein